MILVADIGGTKCLLAMRGDDGKLSEPVRFPSGSYATFDSLLAEYLEQSGAKPTAACLAVAGPVALGGASAHLTQLPWILEAEELAKGFGMKKVTIINDFHAQALAALGLGAGDLEPLQRGEVEPRGAKAVLGAGTGLGQAFLVMAGERYEVVPSEGGHADFAPTTDEEIELLRFLRGRYGGHVSYERVLSGDGIGDLYDFVRIASGTREPPWLAAQIATGDKNAIVSKAALEKSDDVCVRALEMFAQVLGSEAGNMALRAMATGGVVIGGGIPPKNLAALQTGALMARFTDKGRFSAWTKTLAVRVTLEPRAALLGAAHYVATARTAAP